MLKNLVVATVAATVMGAAATANAGTIFSASTLADCNNCYGLTYLLTVDDGAVVGDDTYQATLGVTGTFSGPSSVTRISAVNFKAASDVKGTPFLTAAPTLLSLWATSEANINSGGSGGGCGGGTTGFVCSNTLTGMVALNTGSPLDVTWQWTFRVAAGVTPTPLHIGAKYNNAAGNLSGQILSQKTFSVPDGGMTLALLGLALAGMGIVRRRIL